MPSNAWLKTARSPAKRSPTIATKHSRRIVDTIENFATELTTRCSGAIAKGARYILNHRDRLRVFLRDGNVPLDNNLAERVLRRNALLRKNRLFFVSEDGGSHLATALSVCGSCRLLDINPLAYLTDCLPALLGYRCAKKTGGPLPDLNEHTPLAYAQRIQKIAEASAA